MFGKKKKHPIHFNDWFEIGVKNKWVTPIFCYTHEGDPYMTEDEEKEWDEGGDPCMPVVKILL